MSAKTSQIATRSMSGTLPETRPAELTGKYSVLRLDLHRFNDARKMNKMDKTGMRCRKLVAQRQYRSLERLPDAAAELERIANSKQDFGPRSRKS